MSDDENLSGVVLGGRYELRDVIAGGAQAHLYRARDIRAGDEVAVKLLRNTTSDPNALERFFREANAMTKLVNTAAVRVLDQVPDASGGVALILELLRGRDLDEELRELEEAGERMPSYRVIELFEPIVRTLQIAHDAGIVHRDIKGENVFVVHPAYGGGVRLLDFGFARFTRSQSITQAGMVAGSPRFISPDAWMGKTDLDARADVYSLAVLLFRVLSGKMPFPMYNLVDLMKAVTSAPRPSLHALRPDLPASIDGWVELSLAIDRDQRFSSVTASWNALKSCLRPSY